MICFLFFFGSWSNSTSKNDTQGILVFASVMATLGLQIILESMRTLISDVSRGS